MSSETKVLLIRHAHSTMAGRFCGHMDVALSETGRGQLSDISRHLERWPIAKVYTSDLKRAYDTAAAIAAPRFLPLLVRTGLREINFGDWEGRSWSEIEAIAPKEASSWLQDYPLFPAPGGESLAQFRLRVESEIMAIIEESGENCVAAVTHAGFIRVMVAKVLGIEEKSMHKIEIGYGGVTVLRREEQGWWLEGVNLGPFSGVAQQNTNEKTVPARAPTSS